MKKNCSHAGARIFIAIRAWTFGEWCRSSGCGEGVGFKKLYNRFEYCNVATKEPK